MGIGEKCIGRSEEFGDVKLEYDNVDVSSNVTGEARDVE